MRTMNVRGRGMPWPRGMRKSRRGKAHAGSEWPSLCHWERRTGGGEQTALGNMEWRIHKPEYWRPPRPMDSWFEEQLMAYLEDALTLALLHLGEWHPPLQACGRCQHKDETTSRFLRERWRTAARAAGG